MIRQPKDRQAWLTALSAFFAAVLTTLAGAVPVAGPELAAAGHQPAVERGIDARHSGKPVSARVDAPNPWLFAGNSSGSDPALAARYETRDPWAASPQFSLPDAFRIPLSVARVRDGRTRAPPVA